MLGHLDRALDALVEMPLDHGRHLRVERVQGIDTQELLDLTVLGHGQFLAHRSAPAGFTPSSARLMRSRLRPDRIRLFTVPSGSLEHLGHLAVGVAAEIGQLDGLAQLVGQRAERLLHLLGHGHVPHLAIDVVPGRGGLAGGLLLASAT